MATRLEYLSIEEVRTAILFCMLGMVFFRSCDSSLHSRRLRGEVASRQIVTKWCSDFISGQTGTKDNGRIVSLTAAVTPENKTRVAATVLVNRRVT
jgi:hypothetical protein